MTVADRTLEALSPGECMRLLCSHGVGRVVYSVQAMPAVTPVNYALDDGTVVFRTAAGSRLANATRNAVVAFEVDEIDETRRTGWSVVVTGVARTVDEDEARTYVEGLDLTTWAPGDRSLFVRITPSFVTGRVLVPVDTLP
jgi:nitroimidazol reductase NimA-like FMN-containing flavoprotein (pyridoxamine 5'-phosphate oxidase superfamily)